MSKFTAILVFSSLVFIGAESKTENATKINPSLENIKHLLKQEGIKYSVKDLHNIQDLLLLEAPIHGVASYSGASAQCNGNTCSACIDVPVLPTLCAEIAFNSNGDSSTLRLKLGGLTVIEQDISPDSISPICTATPIPATNLCIQPRFNSKGEVCLTMSVKVLFSNIPLPELCIRLNV